jgi:hypothetical protein
MLDTLSGAHSMALTMRWLLQLTNHSRTSAVAAAHRKQPLPLDPSMLAPPCDDDACALTWVRPLAVAMRSQHRRRQRRAGPVAELGTPKPRARCLLLRTPPAECDEELARAVIHHDDEHAFARFASQAHHHHPVLWLRVLETLGASADGEQQQQHTNWMLWSAVAFLVLSFTTRRVLPKLFRGKAAAAAAAATPKQ